MSAKPAPKADSAEFRISAAEFDRMMRDAMGVAPEKKAPPKKDVYKPKYKKPPHLRMSDAEYDRYMDKMYAKEAAKLKKAKKTGAK